jgi:molybdenum cofactor guanylyltransferase
MGIQSQDIHAFILAGGQSLRMGSDKALVPFRGKPMIEHVSDVLMQRFHTITIVSNHHMHKSLGLPTIADAYDQIGPLGGIIAGLKHSRSEQNLFIGCDMPMVQVEILDKLLQESIRNHNLLPCYQGKTETLCSIISKSALPQLEQAVTEKNYRLYDILLALQPQLVDVSHLCSFNPFANINTPDDLQ